MSMSRPRNKKELVELTAINFNKLLDFIDWLPDEIKTKTYKNNELNYHKTVTEVICHIHDYHLMVEYIYKGGDIPNLGTHKKYKGTELKKVVTIFKKSHKNIMALIEKHADNVCFASKKRYGLKEIMPVGVFSLLSMPRHYDWGLKTIKPLKKLVK